MSNTTINNRKHDPVYLIILGPPGSGKGTQADKLRERHGLAHISTGDLFRENISKGTELGLKVKSILGTGALVPDDLTVAMVMERLKQPDTARGVVFDGFPRTEGQAVALQEAFEREGKQINRVIYFSVPDQVIIERLAARRVCPNDGASYNLKSKPPQDDERCDQDGAQLVLRDDDQPEVVQNRLRVYREQTSPLIQFYRDRNLLTEIDATQSIDAVEEQVERVTKQIYGN